MSFYAHTVALIDRFTRPQTSVRLARANPTLVASNNTPVPNSGIALGNCTYPTSKMIPCKSWFKSLFSRMIRAQQKPKGLTFDQIMERVLALPPQKAKKGSKPKKVETAKQKP